MMKIVFILPYFGKFNNYFQLFLNSCASNPEFDWLVFTDDKRRFKYSKNVKVKYTSFEEFRNYVRGRLDLSVRLDKAYKLCDLRPCYGYIFEDYIEKYDYWGYCDCDLIFGNLSRFINITTLGDCDKFGVLGHLTLIKNNELNNRLFFKGNVYKRILEDTLSHNFDEVYDGSINTIFRDEGRKIIEFSDFADIYTKSSLFRLAHFTGETLKDFSIEKIRKNLFFWDNGELWQIIEKKGLIEKREFAYIHLQKRKMNVNIPLDCKSYKIIPNAFEPLDISPDEIENLDGIKTYNLNFHYYRTRFNNMKNKLKVRVRNG